MHTGVSMERTAYTVIEVNCDSLCHFLGRGSLKKYTLLVSVLVFSVVTKSLWIALL